MRVGATELVTSQLVFDDAPDDEVVAPRPIGKDRGARDNANANDNVAGGATLSDYAFRTARVSDGATLARKALVVRSSAGDALCSAGGAGGPGGPGGPPPGAERGGARLPAPRLRRRGAPVKLRRYAPL